MRSLPPAEVAIASILAFSLWALQTRSWRRPKLLLLKRPGSTRHTEHRILAGPLRGSIAQTRDANPPWQSSFDGSLNEIGCEEGERDRHIDLPNAAVFACGNLLDTGD